MSAFQMNQFGLKNQPGETMNVNPATISVKVTKDLGASSYYYPGDVVDVVAAEAGDAIAVSKISLGSAGLGVILSNAKKGIFSANDMVEIGLRGTIVTMKAATTANRGAVSYIPATGYVAATSGTRIGWMLDICNEVGGLVRVLVDPLA